MEADVQVLEAQRARAALDLREGRAGAADTLRRVENQIAAVNLNAVRDRLADEAAAERAAEAASKRQARERAELGKKHQKLKAEERTALLAVDRHAEVLAGHITEALKLEAERVDVECQLGGRARQVLKRRISGRLRWHLTTLHPEIGDSPSRGDREPLVPAEEAGEQKGN